MGDKKVNINDIAKMAGVSVSAVSRYLNKGYLSEEKSSAIEAAVKKTGYVPSKQAQIMRSKKTKIVGVIVPRLSSEAVSRLVDGISYELERNGYQMIFADTQNDVEKELKYMTLLNNNPVDGILFIATVKTKAHKNVMNKIAVPMVVIGQVFNGFPCVYHDDYGAAKGLTDRMLDNGCKNPACIMVTQSDEAAGVSRLNGFKDSLSSHKIKVAGTHFAESDFSLEGGYAAAGKLLAADKHIDGIFCATDTIAVGALQKIKDMGLRIPEDIKITGVGHNRMSRVVSPKLTTAHLYYKTAGMEGTKMLLDMIESGERSDMQMKLEYEIIDGDSV